jgi:dTDP-4-amino-4,6-dideoxygalactose transaminase
VSDQRRFLPFHRADIGDEEIEAVVAVLRSGWLTSGPRVKEFESAFAAYIGVEHAVAVNSATAALHLGLEAIGVGPGDEVVVPTMTFAASAEVVRYLGARPVLVDCDSRTLTVRASDIEPAITPRTKAIMPVHYGGYVCDLDPILELASAHGVKTLEDAAHALPASYKGRRVGGIGDLTAFSFYATKTLTTGEGGMLTTSDVAYADRARIMSLHGISRHAWNRYAAEGSWRYDILEAGFKYNLTDIAAALGLVQLRRVEAMREGRARVVAAYDAAFSGIPEIRTPARDEWVEHAWHLYPIRLQLPRLTIGRDTFIEALKGKGIGTSVHFIPLHLHPYYQANFGYRPDDFPNALAAFEELVSLPVYPNMSAEEVDRVAQAVVELIHTNRR